MKKIFNLDLFKFEFKNLFKNFLFWAMILASILLIKDANSGLFDLPVSSNEQAFQFLTRWLDKGNCNMYNVRLSSIFDKYDDILMTKERQHLWDIGNYDELISIDKNFSKLKDDINNKIKNDIGNTGLSKMFFRGTSTNLIEISLLSMIFFFPMVWYRDKLYKTSLLVKSRPIKSSQYLFCKFIPGFIIQISVLFVIMIVIGIIAKVKFAKLSFEISMLDMISSFFCFAVWSLLLYAILLSSLTLLFRRAILSSAVAVLLLYEGTVPKLLGLDKSLTFEICDVVTSCFESKGYNLLIQINYDLVDRILCVVLSVCLFWLSCKLWKNIHRGDY